MEKMNLEKENISGTKAAEKKWLLPSVLSFFCNTSSFLFLVYNYSCQKLVYHKFLNPLNTDRQLTTADQTPKLLFENPTLAQTTAIASWTSY